MHLSYNCQGNYSFKHLGQLWKHSYDCAKLLNVLIFLINYKTDIKRRQLKVHKFKTSL